MKCLVNKETRKPVFVLEIPEREASYMKNSNEEVVVDEGQLLNVLLQMEMENEKRM